MNSDTAVKRGPEFQTQLLDLLTEGLQVLANGSEKNAVTYSDVLGHLTSAKMKLEKISHED